ncbi:RanGTP-binding protein-domain-containing protein [Zychaea mexicana]|uniref:RanGTP-binding protein-domain-containing protein n=1 Tax=Zychaea mexicana TaxID=64656 RepID=UPI0022FE8848|nr:RanGTP-binding protein-domain-containing protein [Zychaea mexicana]KAI9469625.1 RanGTP-binding protein-domain-containing protein [Zychaea mexicana]
MSLEDLFGKLAMSTVNTVSRIAISHATNAAIRGVTGYITQQPKGKRESEELKALQRQFDLKIKNLKPTIDMIARSVADGNQDLEPALELCNDLKRDIDRFAQEMEDAKSNNSNDYVRTRLRALLASVDDSVPSLHLALRSLESPYGQKRISSSRLLQASAILKSTRECVFRLRLYSLFAANVREDAAGFTWKEDLAKCQLQVNNKSTTGSSSSPSYAYELKLIESLDDGRYHEEGESPETLAIDLANIKKMYYTRSGALLNIEDSKAPVLVLKVIKKDKKDADKGEKEDAGNIEVKEENPEILESELEQASWYAVEIWTNGDEDDSDDDDNDDDKKDEKQGSAEAAGAKGKQDQEAIDQPSLLLLESVIKLALLEISEQMDHLDASDDLIELYMAE